MRKFVRAIVGVIVGVTLTPLFIAMCAINAVKFGGE